jgi:hypothetical protein
MKIATDIVEKVWTMDFVVENREEQKANMPEDSSALRFSE